MSETLISLKQVLKSFLPKLPPAIADISCEIPKGEIVGLAGPDGAGKTTLMRLMAGLLLPNSGQIEVAGLDTVKEAKEIHAFLGYMPQKFGLYEDLTVMQNLHLYAKLRGLEKEVWAATFEKLLHFTSLGPFVDRLAGRLSGGMKQKLGLACALIKKPKLLLLDEPSVGVDPISRRELWKMVHELVEEGISVVWSTAYLDEAEKCSHVLLLNEGKKLYYGPPSQLSTKGTFEEGFIEILGGPPTEASPLAASSPQIQVKEEAVIVAEGLTKKFGDFTAADQISFKIKQGEIFGLLGPNGAGKSTTFKMLCGLLKPTEGHAYVNGFNLQKAPSEARSHIGYMAQKFSLYGNLSTLQNLEFFSGAYNLIKQKRKKAIEEMVEIFDLTPYLHMAADELSLGYKQRLALACATMHRPATLFLDEPTSGVDPITRLEFWNHIRGLVKKGVTIMVTTHFMDEAEYCDRIALIYRSKMIREGTPASLKEALGSPTLEEAFIQLIEEYDVSHPY